MIFEYTAEEERKLQSIEAEYSELLRKSEERLLALRKEDPEPKTPARPKRGSKKSLDKYQEEKIRAFEEWVERGSDEWKAEREKRYKLLDEKNNKISNLWHECERKHFEAFNGDKEKILQNVSVQVPLIIKRYYDSIKEMAMTGTVTDRAVRAVDNGFYLDSVQMIDVARKSLHLHIEALKDDKEALEKIDSIIYGYISSSPYISSEAGKLEGEVSIRQLTQLPDFIVQVTRPTQYLTTTDMISKQLFNNELTSVEDNEVFPVTVSNKKSAQINIYASINYESMLKSGEISKAPELNDFDWWVHDGIITNLLAGNRTMTIDMIYRGMTGKVDGDINVSEYIKNDILNSLTKFRGLVTIDNYLETRAKKDRARVIYKEPVLFFTWCSVTLYGKTVTAIKVPDSTDSDPVLLKWARFNGNEIDTRDIKLLNVPGLNNGEESAPLKMRLYRRLIAMRHSYDESVLSKKPMKMSRVIRYDDIYSVLGIENPNKDKRKLLKQKIDKCLTYWANNGLFVSYEHIKDKKGLFYAIEINFIEPKKLTDTKQGD